MKRKIAILIVAVAASVSQGASAQQNRGQGQLGTGAGVNELPAMVEPSAQDDMLGGPPQIPDPAGPYQAGPYSTGPEEIAPPVATDDQEPAPFVPGDTVRMLECQPALTESSGTWLQRGFWYVETDVVLFNRTWNADRLPLAIERFRDESISPFIPQVDANYLSIDETPGIEALPRLTLGKFLFRDSKNRDHTAELTWLGEGEWSESASLQAVTPGDFVALGSGGTITGAAPVGGLQVPYFIDGSGFGDPDGTTFRPSANPSFDGASEMEFAYDAHLDSVEVNYSVSQRMRRDRMILEPDGRWVRQATPTTTLGFLAGIRYINYREALAFSATGIPNVQREPDGTPVVVDDDIVVDQESGEYFIATDNNILGTQVGLSYAHERSRWSVGVDAKIGGYWNAMDLNSVFNITGGVGSGASNATKDQLSIVGEAALRGKWHLTPNWSIRSGIEMMWLERLALAPHHLNFIPGGYNVIVDTGGVVMFGTSIGVEAYW